MDLLLFDSLVGGIYDAVVDPTLWEPAIDRIRTVFGFHIAMIGVNKLPGGENVIAVSSNVRAHYVAAIQTFGPEIWDVWGGPDRVAMQPLGVPLMMSRVSERQYWISNRYYLEWGKPQGLVDQVVIVLARDSATMGSIGFGIHESTRPIGDKDLADLALIGPHLRRAVTISRLLDRTISSAASFSAALDTSASGVVLVDEELRVVHANAAAADMLRYADPVRSSGGRLELIDELVPSQLQQAIHAAARSEAQLGQRVGIPARRRDGSPMVAHVMPLKRRESVGQARGAVAAVLLATPAAASALPLDAMVALFDLTPTETQILEHLVTGRSTSQIAAAQAIAASTVKTHVLSIFQKTGRHRRADLLALTRELSAPG